MNELLETVGFTKWRWRRLDLLCDDSTSNDADAIENAQ